MCAKSLSQCFIDVWLVATVLDVACSGELQLALPSVHGSSLGPHRAAGPAVGDSVPAGDQ